MLLLAMMLESRLSPLSLGGGVFIYAALYLTIVGDAVREARQQGESFQPKWYNRWYVYLTAIVVAPFVLHPAIHLPMQKAPVRAFKMSSQSMEPTLLEGDYILVAPWAPSHGSLKRQDIVVFEAPSDNASVFLKRITALPGERVALGQHQLLVHNQPVSEDYIRVDKANGQGDFGPVVVPKKGDTLDIRNDGQVYLNDQPLALPAGRFAPYQHEISMTGFEVFYGPFFPSGATLQKPAGPVTVPDDYYFVLGDHRNYSRDSRSWGFVAAPQIQGRVIKIYWSWDRAAKRVRWDRIGLDLQG